MLLPVSRVVLSVHLSLFAPRALAHTLASFSRLDVLLAVDSSTERCVFAGAQPRRTLIRDKHTHHFSLFFSFSVPSFIRHLHSHFAFPVVHSSRTRRRPRWRSFTRTSVIARRASIFQSSISGALPSVTRRCVVVCRVLCVQVIQ
jgi:hypothetical protein